MAKEVCAFQILQDATAPAAFHNSAERRDPPKCHPKTRLAVLKKIMQWVMGVDPMTSNHSIMWVLGAAGSGKSAIEQTIAEMLFAEDRLLASFFFSRLDPTRNRSRTLIPTLAYQIATSFPDVRHAIQCALETDPLLVNRSLSAQVRYLLVQPLQPLIQAGHFGSPHSRRVIVIDGLDECEARKEQTQILNAISECLNRHGLPFLFLIASRPEQEIMHTFTSESLINVTVQLILDSWFVPSDDIKVFLSDAFLEIKERHPLKSTIPYGWPSDEMLETLVDKSSGQFIYAARVVRFMQSMRHRPVDRLEIILGLRQPSHDMPFGELDALYHQIFEAVKDKETTLDILSCGLLTHGCKPLLGLSMADIEAILSLRPGDVQLALCDLHSIVGISPGSAFSFETLYFFHSSFRDFIFDKRRSGALHIDAPAQHCKLALKILEKDWVFNYESKIFLDLLGWHIANAEPSPALLKAVSGLDIVRAYSSCNWRKHWLVQSIGPFLKHIKNSKFSNADDIYTLHFQKFYTYASRELQNYYTCPALTSLLATVCFPSLVDDEDIFATFAVSEFITEPVGPDKGLYISDSQSVKVESDYSNLIRQIINDPDKPELYFDSSRYATAALYVAKHCFRTSINGLSAFPSPKRLKHSPWKWRKKVIWRYKAAEWDFFYSFWWKVRFSRTYRLRRQPKGAVQRNWIQVAALPSGRKYHSDFLICFSGFLEMAGPSEELSACVSKMPFDLLAHTYTREFEQARAAIKGYLDRQRAPSD